MIDESTFSASPYGIPARIAEKVTGVFAGDGGHGDSEDD
jgi:hypothetical protein